MSAGARTGRRPLVGVTLDAEPAGGWSAFPWYALRGNYLDAVAAAGGLPVALAHLPDLAPDMLDAIDALVVTGGAFDIDPALYGDAAAHPSTSLKPDRTRAELALVEGAIARGMPLLGICGGMQLLAVALGGTLIQHLPDEPRDPAAPRIAHEQPGPRDRPGHEVALAAGSRLAAIAAGGAGGAGGGARMAVNSAHHQAVRDPGRALVSARAPDGVIEAIERAGEAFCLGVQWHPEFGIDAGDGRLFEALVAAARDRDRAVPLG